ncbi:MAG: hypothetical protein ACPG8W_14790 [Candidatus Promineifilaceae bacterium]
MEERNDQATLYQQSGVVWHKTTSAEFPYMACVGDAAWKIRLNDFPEEDLYTLMIDGQSIADFNDWPEAWKR